MKIDSFTKGFIQLDSKSEELYLSISPGFELGPGIQRDGVTRPRMTDPRTVAFVARTLVQPVIPGPVGPGAFRIDPDEQRWGTWSLYRHLKEFMQAKPCWRVVALQSNGDLTMNFWHVAYWTESHIPALQATPE